MFDNFYDDDYGYEQDPDPEEDRYSIWDEDRGDYVSVYDVTRLKRWWRFITYDYAYKVHGPLFRLRHNIWRHFKRCVYCGKRGCGPYWFSNTCSKACSDAEYARHCADKKKLHLRRTEHHTYCNEWIWQEIQLGAWMGSQDNDKFCSTCLKKAKCR